MDQMAIAIPSFVPSEAGTAALLSSLRRYVSDFDESSGHSRMCVKVDIEPGATGFSNLNLSCGEPLPNVIWLLPGKMTEAPCAADLIVQILSERLGERAMGAPSARSRLGATE